MRLIIMINIRIILGERERRGGAGVRWLSSLRPALYAQSVCWKQGEHAAALILVLHIPKNCTTEGKNKKCIIWLCRLLFSLCSITAATEALCMFGNMTQQH